MYSPALTDFVFMVRNSSHMFLTGGQTVGCQAQVSVPRLLQCQLEIDTQCQAVHLPCVLYMSSEQPSVLCSALMCLPALSCRSRCGEERDA